MRDIEELLTSEEICQKLKISYSGFKKLLFVPDFPAIKVQGRWKAYPSELDRWVRDNSKNAGVNQFPARDGKKVYTLRTPDEYQKSIAKAK